MTKSDQLLQVTADWEVSCLELEDVIGKAQTLDAAILIWKHVRHLRDRLEQVQTIATRRCHELGGKL